MSQASAPFQHAIGQWLLELKDMPNLRTVRGGKANPLIGGMTRDIAKLGLFGFHDLTKSCETYQDLQKALSAGWMKKDAAPKKSKRQVTAERIQRANQEWSNDELSDACTDSSQDLSSSSSSTAIRRVVLLVPGEAVNIDGLRLAPAFNGRTGKLIEAQASGRFVVEFAEPKCTLSLQGANLTPA
eukprot:TRINITY_DN13845_c0_g1_i1.p1 TRINITY_DN13845_c0_g1~~TRINITY_DN13845_c0_g1_i1.p1  ORF type:complete len:185 (+),score=82.19 TRINITY_DN13845_c0_g1_i1:200-754(+)